MLKITKNAQPSTTLQRNQYRCRHALTPLAADDARLGSSTRWLGDRGLLAPSCSSRCLEIALDSQRDHQFGLKEALPYCDLFVLQDNAFRNNDRLSLSWRGYRWCPVMSKPISPALFLIMLAARLDVSRSLALRIFASPGQRLLNASPGRLLALPGW